MARGAFLLTLAFVGVQFFTSLGFCSIILIPDMLKSESKALETQMII